MSDKVAAVVVTFNPELPALASLLVAVRSQVASIIIVDNGSRADVGRWAASGGLDVDVVALGRNLGIAAAHNIGIKAARRTNAEFVLLLDQDSLPDAQMVSRLIDAYRELVRVGLRVAAVGPNYSDDRLDQGSPFVRREGLRLRRQDCTGAFVEVPFLISSGSLIALAALDAVGAMHEELFIDYVDIEWGLRAGKFGYKSFGVCAARMTHRLGERMVEIAGRRIPVHNPTRLYYSIRNGAWLGTRPWLSWGWRLTLWRRIAMQLVVFSLFASPRRDNLTMMLRALGHALAGKLGPLRAR